MASVSSVTSGALTVASGAILDALKKEEDWKAYEKELSEYKEDSRLYRDLKAKMRKGVPANVLIRHEFFDSLRVKPDLPSSCVRFFSSDGNPEAHIPEYYSDASSNLSSSSESVDGLSDILSNMSNDSHDESDIQDQLIQEAKIHLFEEPGYAKTITLN